MDHAAVITHVRRWIEAFVIGLNLCPFARRVFDGGLIRYVVTEASDPADLFEVLSDELCFLAAVPSSQVETTLLIHPLALADFQAYNDFLGDGERLLGQLGLCGTIQIASFHPEYRFADAVPDAPENYTNRSPYPMLHLLREESLSRIAGDPDELAGIPRRNIAALRVAGHEKLLAMLKAIETEDQLGADHAP